MLNKLIKKNDIFRFGVVLLKIIIDCLAIVKTNEKTQKVKWVDSMLPSKDIGNIVDSRLKGQFETNSIREALYIALLSRFGLLKG